MFIHKLEGARGL